ncbi:MAG: SoxY-related AACIE arm protein [Leptothrix sp. (in: Bacteria)]|nr:SoxY-related AACIE arm protein [Leptothrix sp. (in: b-proteobacteria)]
MKLAQRSPRPGRRQLLLAGAAGLLLQRPARAEPTAASLAAIERFTAGRPARDGRVVLGLDAVVENGNTVPITVTVDSPMSPADHVQRIAVFTERNPLPEVVVFHLGPASGLAQVATRMRMAQSQTVTAIAAMSDGSFWRHRVDVVVALAACLEGG